MVCGVGQNHHSEEWYLRVYFIPTYFYTYEEKEGGSFLNTFSPIEAIVILTLLQPFVINSKRFLFRDIDFKLIVLIRFFIWSTTAPFFF